MGQLTLDKDLSDGCDEGKESKGALSRLLELTPALTKLPSISNDVVDAGGRWNVHEAQQVDVVVDSVDSIKGLFNHISKLAREVQGTKRTDDTSADLASSASSEFDTRIQMYLQTLQGVNTLTKKEKYKFEQRLQAVRSVSSSQRKISPPPLPLPTQNCMVLGWDLAIQLMKATRREGSGEIYLRALETILSTLSALKPLAYLDGMYLSPSASQSFDLLCDFLIHAATPVRERESTVEETICRQSVETLAELALVRGSLTYLLSSVLWMVSHPNATVELNALLAKLSAVKEQSLYGICEASGELYCCGQNSYGELGVGDDIERHQLTFVPFGGWDDIRQVVSGNEILAILTNNGVVLTAGLNKSGQCGHGHFDERVMLLRPVEALRSQKIRFIAASNGCEHMIALTDTGLAYSWGYNDRGQLGHENLTTKIHQPKFLESVRDKKINFAAVSYHHSAIIAEKGDLYTFGMNDCGQLGQDTTTHQSVPQHVKALEGYVVTVVSCGLYHTVVCTSAGELFTFGKNDYGQLGVGHNRQSKTPCLVSTPNEQICFVTCGYYHSLAVASSGKVFSFGRNDYGQLGIGTKVHQSVPQPIPVTNRITRAACGCYHTVILSEQGQVFVFGRNNKGQLGNRGNTDSLLPVPLKVRPEKSNRRVLDIAAGFYTTSLIVERRKEASEDATDVADQSWVVTLCGRVDIDRSGEIEGLSNFGSLSTVGVSLYRGKWFYEVEVVTSGLIQIGWIDGYFQGSSDQGEGVGDHAHSWSYDGNRQRRWNSGSSAYGDKWKAGDIIGCLLDLDAREMRFYRNGQDLGVAYSNLTVDVSDTRGGLMPGISLERGEVIRLNLGHRAFAFPVGGVEGIARAIGTPLSEVVMTALPSVPSAPEALEGSARVLVGNRLFVIGGMLSSPTGDKGVSTNKVWVYSQTEHKWDRWSDLPIGLRYHQAVLVDDHTLLVIGGEADGPVSRHLDLYRCSTISNADGSFPPWELIQGTSTTSLPPPRAHHTASAIRVRLETLVLVYGGRTTDDTLLGDTWFLSLEDMSWAKLPSSVALDPGPRAGCSSCVVGESVYIFGGLDKEDRLRADLWRYNTFDRVWHLCHDDYIFTPRDSNDSGYNPPLPSVRMHYSIASDLGTIWVYGGETRKGELLNDLWAYSLTRATWTNVEIASEDAVTGIARAALFVPIGSVCAFDSQRSQGVILYGGRVSYGGEELAKWETTIRVLTPTSSVKIAKSTTSATPSLLVGKASTVLASLRAKKPPYHCPPTAKDTATCILAHLDRLLGGDVPPVDATDSVQPSRSSYRSLCIDPKEQSFVILLDMLLLLAKPLFDPEKVTALTGESLYPLLVVLRLVKFNFFELSTSGLSLEDFGFGATESGGVLCELRDFLFRLADFVPSASTPNDFAWFCHAIQRETVAAINCGFSVMFPSLFDRMQVLTRLLQNKSGNDVSELLVPMLVPNFSSPKALFELMSDSVLEGTDSARVFNVVAAFADTLLQALWLKTESALGALVRSDDPHNIDTSTEFQCFNVLLRSTIFWVSESDKGWPITKHISTQLLHYMERILDTTSIYALPPATIVAFLEMSFPARFLPFILLSMCSLPSIQSNFVTCMADLWMNLETLLDKIHKFLNAHDTVDPSVVVPPSGSHTSLSVLSIDDNQLLQCPTVTLSASLAELLGLSSHSLPGSELAMILWEHLRTTGTFSRLNLTVRNFDLYRVLLSSSTSNVLQTRFLTIGYNGDTDDLSRVSYDGTKVCLKFSWEILTPHLSLKNGSQQNSTRTFSTVTKTPSSCYDNDWATHVLWLHDFQKLLSYVGSRFASALILGEDTSTIPHPISGDLGRWTSSPLFRGGLEEASTTGRDDRNDRILQQILDNEGAGSKLIEKVKAALDPDAHLNPKLRAASTRLKRVDSVERTLEKSGGYEAVDRAVRSTFAVLIKHTHVSYMSDPVTKEGIPGEALLDAWRSALQLRRWIVREQQKLAVSSSEGKVTEDEDNEGAKERQQILYKQVCDPIVARARLLLKLAAVPVLAQETNYSPLKILPGISSTPFDFSQHGVAARVSPSEPSSVPEEQQQLWLRQLNRLMETKSMEMIEEEDERIQTDIFAFLQQTEDTSVEHEMIKLLEHHQLRAIQRQQGLEIFFTLLRCTANIPAARFHLLPTLATSFQSKAQNEKVHYSHAIELAGRQKLQAIGEQFFSLVSHLLKHASTVVTAMKQSYCTVAIDKMKPSVQSMHQHVHELLLALDVCSIPYKPDDWPHIASSCLPSFLADMVSWSSWKQLFSVEDHDDSSSIESVHHKPPILPVGIGSSTMHFFTSGTIHVENDTHVVTSTQAPNDPFNPSSLVDAGGGLAVAARPLSKGRWYWEIVWRHQGAFPIFVGVSNGCSNVNSAFGNVGSSVGILVTKEKLDGSPLPFHAWPRLQPIGVLVDCEAKILEVYAGIKKIHSLSLAQISSNGIFFPFVGLVDGEIQWDLYAPVPARLGISSGSKFTFVAGGLVVESFGGHALGWSGCTKGPNLHLSNDCSTIVAGDCMLTTPQVETVITNKSFIEGHLYVELSVFTTRASIIVGIVDATFSTVSGAIEDGLHLEYDDFEQDSGDKLVGILFDFNDGKLTVYQKRKDAIVHSIDLSTISSPYVPALSVLCNGAIVFTNFHPTPRPHLPPLSIYPTSKGTIASATSTEKQIGKLLEFHVQSCDGGEFSTNHAVTNCLVDDTTVYSSASMQNVTIVLKHATDTPFCITYAMARGPGASYTAPLQHAIVFIMSSPPDLDELDAYNGLTPDEFATLPKAPVDAHVKRDETIPVLFFVLDGNCSQVSKRLSAPTTGRYIVVKLLRASPSGTNIDVGYLGFCGAFDKDNGPAYSELFWEEYMCTECNVCPLPGICYIHDDDERIKLCPSCYDDKRGPLDTGFYACVPSEEEDRGEAATSVLCVAREQWYKTVQALYDVTKPSIITSGEGNDGSAALSPPIQDDIFDDVELFACGQNNYGELCLGHCNSTSKLEHVPLFTSKSVKQMTGGNEVLAVVMRDGVVYTCGLNKSGQCGNGTFEERVVLAAPVRALSGIPIAMVAAANGCEHMVAVAQDGSAYSWGYNDRGQLGLGSTISKSHTPKLIESLHEKYIIVTAGVSYHHSAVVTSHGELLTFGMNDCGQLGLDHTQHQHTPQLVDALSSQVVTKVSCGLYHTVIVTAGGDVYTCGKNDYGQLGLGHSRSVKVPTHMKLTDSDDKVVNGWSGYYHSALITDKGKLITFGRNDYGQLGIGSKEHRNLPQTVPLPAGSKVISAACGCYHTLILLANGRVMVFGRNNKGQLGAGARTLPSADLPLPIPSSSLSSDDVVAIAAGFYSSYILTGRRSESSGQKAKDGNAKDASTAAACMNDQPSVTSEALFESLMREMDRNAVSDTPQETSPLSLKRSNISKKLPLLKLLAGTWAMIRALMYQSLTSSKKPTVNQVLKGFLSSMLQNLTEASKHSSSNVSSEDEIFFNLSDASVGLIKYCASDKIKSDTIGVLAQLFSNQVLWVLLTCGSVHTDVCSVLASSPVILQEVIRGMVSPTLSSSIISMRLGMLTLPLQSVSGVNKVYRAIAASSAPADIMNFLFLVVGYPLVLRPPLCKHEMGIETATTSLCNYFNCTKGVAVDAPLSTELTRLVDKHHVNHAKASEAVALVRYLTLFPIWKKAVGATIKRALEKTDAIDDLLTTITKFYEHFANAPADKLPMDEVVQDDVVVMRQPENTAAPSPELDETSLESAVPSDKRIDVISESLSFDKKAASLRKKAKDALDQATLLMASIGVLGGHTELLREGGHILFEDFEMRGRFKGGVLVGLKKNAKAASIDGCINLFDDTVDSPLLVPLKLVQAVERIPAMPQMFDDHFSDALQALSKLIVPSFATTPASLNPNVHAIIGSMIKSYKSQVQWRATKALSTVLKQLPALDTSTSNNLDVSIVSNIASLLATESSALAMQKATVVDESTLDVAYLHAKWFAIKEHQAVLAAEHVIDSALDSVESHVRDEVVQRLGSENALSWGADAIQSPKKRMSSVLANKPTVAMQNKTSNETGAVPLGVWGMLVPVLGAEAAQQDHSFHSTFHLRSPVVRVGRATDSCDIVINDRSVSGRHFHLRRVRHDGHSANMHNHEEYFELQDFSKNGTIVNGVRVHGASIRVSHGSRISLILSRGGMVTYEFHVTSSSSNGPPSLSPSLTAATTIGQESQQMETNEPRSPAEVQNRGIVPSSFRARLGPQGLRLVTTIGESEVPRALISPNPAVDSPRLSHHASNPPPIAISVHSPRTPAVNSPAAAYPSGVLSPASFQQRESSGGSQPHGEMAVSEALRIALGRESLLRSEGDGNLGRTRVMNASGEVTLPKKATKLAVDAKASVSDVAKDLCKRVRDLGGHSVELDLCEKALQLHQGDVVRALKYVQETIGKAQSKGLSPQHHLAARSLSRILGRSVSVCSRALKASGDNIGLALRSLLFTPQQEDTTPTIDDENDQQDNLVSQQFDKFVSQAVDQLSGSSSDIPDENPSYSLQETSVNASPRRSLRPTASPTRSIKKKDEASGSAATALLPWSICTANVDERIKTLGWRDADVEEDILSQLLCAAHARKLLLQVIRLLQPHQNKAAESSPLCSFGDRSTLRQLILFPEVSSNVETSAVAAHTPGRIQQILARISQDVIQASTTRTLELNMRIFQNISTLANSIDQSDQLSDDQRNHPTTHHVLQTLLGAGVAESTGTICEDLVLDTMMHVMSRMLSTKGSTLDSGDKSNVSEYPKGPFLLSSGLEVAVIASYERIWGVPSPDPLLQYRHKWRKKHSEKDRASFDTSVTLWRPVLPSAFQSTLVAPDKWFALSDVAKCGSDAPSSPILMVRDNQDGCVAPPIRFDCVDVSGKGLPKNSELDLELERKQIRSVWWPIAPPGYVALGCVAGTKYAPFEAPPLDSYRCVRADLVQPIESASCIWHTQNTSLWTVSTDYAQHVVPSAIHLNAPPDRVHVLQLSDDDRILCAPVTTATVLRLVDALLYAHSCLGSQQHMQMLVPELSSALFMLIKHAVGERRGSPVTVELVRTLTTLIRNRCPWNDKEGVLYVRSKVMFLYQDQEGSLMLSALLQALVELLIVVDSRHRAAKQTIFSKLPVYDIASTLPYTFDVPKQTALTPVHGQKVSVKTLPHHQFYFTFPSTSVSGDEDSKADVDAASPLFLSSRLDDAAPLRISMVGSSNSIATIVYYEVHVEEVKVGTRTPGFSFGFATNDFALDGVCVGVASKSYAFTPPTGKIQCGDPLVDVWSWPETSHAVARGDVFGCGLRLDSHEIFFTKNGRWLGTAFSSILGDTQLHPTVSVDTEATLVLSLAHPLEQNKLLFQLDTTDWDAPMHGFEWFDHLRQVYGIMDSLEDRTPLPDEFLLSADNFLSAISTDVCQSFASTHPYDLELQEQTIHIALATSMRIKLDPACETAGSHCLQIVQGSADESAESEVRTFTGSCGGQEITVDGNEFTWRFPVQSNFQCRIDRVRKGPYIKLDNRDTRLSLTRDKGWQTAIGVARFDSGIHTWEVKIALVTASSNIFLGIARKDVRFDSYLGKDNRGWGWIGNRALWHNGSKQRGTYGEKFKTGDIIRLTLDLKRGTLSYALNGKDLGVAFGPGGTGPKLEGTFYPGFALYNQRDVVELIGGHRLEDSGVDTTLTTAASSTSLSGDMIMDDAIYASDDDDIDLATEAVPNYRVELATVLSQMGFPMDWCVYALKHCDDDAEQAADFILGNMHAMEALVREEAEAYSRSLIAREDVSVMTPLDTDIEEVAPPPPPTVAPSLPDPLTTVDLSTPTANEKWGVAFTVVPEFSVVGRQLLALKYAEELKTLHKAQAVFDLEHDEAIVSIVNAFCEAKAEANVPCDPLRLRPEEFRPTDDDFSLYPCLNGLPLTALQSRFLILRNFNARLQHVLSLIDYSARESASRLTKSLRALRGCVFQTVKLNWWFGILKEQQTPAAARPEIEVDRHKASEATEKTSVVDAVYSQCFAQLHPLQGSLLRGHDRAFKCQFVGEFGDDFGGLYRECLAQMSTELQTSSFLPLLQPCPNEVNNAGEFRECFVPNIHLRNDPKLIQMAEFLGKLMGIAIRSKTPLDLNLPPAIWKYLVDQPVCRTDIESIHQGCFQVVDTINNITKHGITCNMFDDLIDASFTVLSSDKHEVELVPGGKQVRVTWDDKEEYAKAVEAYRLTEFKPVCQDIARGLATIVPLPTLALLTWRDLAILTCGKATVDIELLKRRTTYGDGCAATDPHIGFFWDVLREFTDVQKSAFLRFVWGRSRLPTHAADFTQDFKISGMPKAVGKADTYLPLAHTCFFSIDMPAYSSKAVMKEKLLYAITHCSSIDADNTTVAQRAGQGLNWTRAAGET